MDSTQLRLHAQMEQAHWWFVGRRRIMRALVDRLLSSGGGGRIVDVGCGTGGNIGALAEVYDVAGIDSSETAIEIARAHHPAVRFWCGQLADAPRDLDGDADIYLIMDVLEHVPDDFLLLSTLLSRARAGAQVLITVPAHLHLWSPHDEALGHYRRYDRDRLAMLWEGLPVEVRLLSYFNSRLYWPIRVVRTVARRLGRSYGREGTDLSVPPAPLNRALSELFAGEARVLLRGLDSPRPEAYRTGASLMAVLRVGSDSIEPRTRPPHAPADPVPGAVT